MSVAIRLTGVAIGLTPLTWLGKPAKVSDDQTNGELPAGEWLHGPSYVAEGKFCAYPPPPQKDNVGQPEPRLVPSRRSDRGRRRHYDVRDF